MHTAHGGAKAQWLTRVVEKQLHQLHATCYSATGCGDIIGADGGVYHVRSIDETQNTASLEAVGHR
jgi:hypothetical protein